MVGASLAALGRPPMLQPMALKGIFAKVFDLSISIACFIAHIFYAVYAQNSPCAAPASHEHIQTVTHTLTHERSVPCLVSVCVLRRWTSNSCQRAEEKPQCGTLCALKFPQVPFIPDFGAKEKRENAVAKEMRSPHPPHGGVAAVGHGYLVAFSFLHFPPTDKVGSLRSIWFAVFLSVLALLLSVCQTRNLEKNIAN